jgi:hypothetical protein
LGFFSRVIVSPLVLVGLLVSGITVIPAGAPLPAVAASKTLKSAPPAITGALASGQILSASVGAWTAGTKFKFQWLREDLPIPRATSRQYRVTDADLGQRLSVAVTGSKVGFKTRTIKSKQTDFVGLIKVEQNPSITGGMTLGAALTANPGVFSPQPSEFLYQWLKSGIEIPNAISSQYNLTSLDFGGVFSVRVTVRRAGFQPLVVTSEPTGVFVEPASNLALPTISFGSLINGQSLTANPGLWNPSDASFSYQWMRNGVALAGATSQQYLLTEQDARSNISVVVTARHPNYSVNSAQSAPVGPIRLVRTLLGPAYTALSSHDRCDGTGYRTCERDSSGLSGSTNGVAYYAGSRTSDFLYARVSVPWPVAGKRISQWRLIARGLDADTFFAIFPASSGTSMESEIFLTGGQGSYREKTWTSSWTTVGINSDKAYFSVGITDWGHAYLANYAIEVLYED